MTDHITTPEFDEFASAPDEFTASFGPAAADILQSGSGLPVDADPAATEPEAPDSDAEAPGRDQDGARSDGDPADGDTPSDESDQDDAGGNREAAKYRRRLRDTETERDTLRDRLTVLQRSEVERLVANRFRDPADVWRDGARVDDLLDDNGDIDPAKVNTAATAVLKAHPHWDIAAAPRSPREGQLQSGASAPAMPRRDPFTAAFAPREH
ncbi:hypothetical protein VST63_16030 [Mycolicibacterium sp. 050232]|uniref:hypothetical protein n=1 Tax=Mycolicibacterium sp. 050232 TaxID=3113982 RepID=UPI002E2DB83E|nr:hypothetical protein [Mycolicibacterium sp. 050232]MED5813868.1 hypothetical protein [Mycolicibacterium sp. 050232]